MSDPSESLDQALVMGQLGYKVVPVPPGEKYPRGIGSWQTKATSDSDQIHRWWGRGEAGIGWVMGAQPNGSYLVAIDVDVAEGKVGKTTLEAIIAEHEIGNSFAFTTTQRTGSGGVHFIFEAPPDCGITNGVLGTNVDIRGEGGFIVIAPSVHPNGKPYRWIEGKAPWGLPPNQLPEQIMTLLQPAPAPEPPPRAPSAQTDGDHPGDWARIYLSIAQMLAEAGWIYMETKGTDQYWCRPGKNPKDGHSAILHEGGPLVIWSTSAPLAFWRTGKDNPDGSRSLSALEVYAAIHNEGNIAHAMSDIRTKLMPRAERVTDILSTIPVQPPRPSADKGEATAESGQPVAFAELNLPDEFWQQRPWLTHIRRAADHRQASADAILGALFTRFAAVVPPCYSIPAIVMAKSTFDHFSVLVAETSGGKSGAMTISQELFPGPDYKTIVWNYPNPTGEGLVDAFFEFTDEMVDGKKVRINRKVKDAVHFSIDEAMQLVEAGANRKGATIGSVLCTAWSGGNPGQGNASADRKRVALLPGTFRISGLAAIQLSLGHNLLSDSWVQQGLSGRLVFFAAEDPGIIHWRDRPEWPGPLDWPVPPTTPTVMQYAQEIIEEVLEQHWLKMTKRVHEAPIDGHLRLVKLKLSGLIALIEGRTNVTTDDWDLVNLLLRSHLAIRDRMFAALKQHQLLEGTRRAESAAYYEETRDDLKERRAIARMRDSIIRKITDKGPMKLRDLRQACVSSATKPRFKPALEAAIHDGAVLEDNGVIRLP